MPQAAGDALALRELYGGAILMRLPLRFRDVSDFRPVPHHQEVCDYAVAVCSCVLAGLAAAENAQISSHIAKQKQGMAEAQAALVWADPNEDQSLVMEVVEHNPSISDADCARHYWEDQVHCNQATSSTMNGTRQLGADDLLQVPSGSVSYACIIEGIQVASKGQQSVEAANQVHVLLAVLRMPHVRSDLLITLNSPMVISPLSQAAEHAGAGSKLQFEAAPALMQQMLSSLQIVDWRLFG